MLLLCATVACAPGCKAAKTGQHTSAPAIQPTKPQTPGAKSQTAAQANPAPAQPLHPPLGAVQKNPTFKWVENGQIRMDAKARSGRADELTRVAELVDFSANLYENGKLTSTMTAPKVLADMDKRIVTATGGVTMKSLDRATVVKADWMKWFAKEQKVVGNGGVKIDSHKGPKDYYTLEGAAFTADTALKTLTVENSAKGIIHR